MLIFKDKLYHIPNGESINFFYPGSTYKKINNKKLSKKYNIKILRLDYKILIPEKLSRTAYYIRNHCHSSIYLNTSIS